MRRPPYELACCLRRLSRLVACDVYRYVTHVMGKFSDSPIAAEAMILSHAPADIDPALTCNDIPDSRFLS